MLDEVDLKLPSYCFMKKSSLKPAREVWCDMLGGVVGLVQGEYVFK